MKMMKQVQIKARYALKHNDILTGVVCYLIRSSNGHDEYCTTVVNGKATGCTCPAHKPCYHMQQLEAKEAERKRQAALAAFKAADSIVSSSTPQKRATSTQDARSSVQPPVVTTPLARGAVGAPVSISERMERAPLTKNNQAFSILR